LAYTQQCSIWESSNTHAALRSAAFQHHATAALIKRYALHVPINSDMSCIESLAYIN